MLTWFRNDVSSQETCSMTVTLICCHSGCSCADRLAHASICRSSGLLSAHTDPCILILELFLFRIAYNSELSL